MIEEIHNLSLDVPCIAALRVYFCGLVSVDLARKKRKKGNGHVKYAREMMREMKEVFKNKGVNNLHRYLLMKA